MSSCTLNLIFVEVFSPLINPVKLSLSLSEILNFSSPSLKTDPDKYISVIPKEKRDDLINAYYEYLTSSDKEIREQASLAWTKWELSTSHLIKKEINFTKNERNLFSDAFARIECHYFVNKIFLEDNFILKNIKIIESIPTKIIQGRYDIVCPMRSAWDLNKKLKNSSLYIVDNAGHSMSEQGITLKLLETIHNL